MYWKRAIILVDMNAFFASVEQLDHPELRGKPIAVTNGKQGTCIITASYEARAFGIKTGMRLRLARELCPKLIICPSHPKRYAEVSSLIMHTLNNITPDIEVFSIDEAFLDVSGCQRLWGHPEHIGLRTKELVKAVSGLYCSVGVSGDKTTAKFAAKQHKPDGFCMITPDEATSRLANVPVTELCGIGPGIARFLAKHGVHVCGDMQKLPIGVLGKRFGNLGRRIWYMCQGNDPDPVHTQATAVKSLGHGKVMPPMTTDKKIILTYLKHMCEKVAMRLRRHQLMARWFFIGFRQQSDRQWVACKLQTVTPTHHGQDIFTLGKALLTTQWHGQGLCQLQVTALDPHPQQLQQELFDNPTINKIDQTIDQINARFGDFSITSATLLSRSEMHDVIAPAWRPNGERRSV